MNRFGMLVVGVVLVILGIILQWSLIDFLIDTVGIITLIIGSILVVLSLVQMVARSGKGQSGY